MKSIRQAVRAPASNTVLKAAMLTGVGVWMGSAAPALANPADLFGLGAREASMGNAFTAVADDPFATYYNMGGLAQLKRTTLSVSVQLGHLAMGDPDNCVNPDGVGCSEPFWYNQAGTLTKQQKRYGYDEPHGIALGISVPFTKKLIFGVSAYLPLDVEYDAHGSISGIGSRLTRVMTIDPYLPDYVMYQNRPQRFTGYAGLAYEVVPGLGVGIGAEMLAKASLGVSVDGTVGVEQGPTDANGNPTTVVNANLNSGISMDLKPHSALVGGILWNLGSISPKLQAWQIGASYRSKIKLPATTTIGADLAVSAQLSQDEQPLTYGASIADIGLTLVDFYTPQQVSFGFSGLIVDRLRVAVDATWANWKSFEPSVVSLPSDPMQALGMTINVGTGRTIENEHYRDVIVPRLGLEGRLGPFNTGSRFKGLDLYLRAGGSFEQNPFPNQTRYNNLLNADTIKVAGGVGVTTHNPLATTRDLPVSLDFSMQYHYLLPTTYTKDADLSGDTTDGVPVDGVYVAKGSALQGALTLQFGF